MERRIAVRAIIVKDGKLFCVKLHPYNEVITGEYWCTVGGGINSNESLVSALNREVFEETGVTPVIGNLLYIQQYVGSGKEHLEFFFHVTNAEDFYNIDLDKTTHGKQEIAQMDFIFTENETVYPDFLKQEDFSDLANQPTKFFSSL